MIGMNGMSLVRDLFTLYVFLEIVAISSFILIGMKQSREALEGTFKYVVLSAAASAMMLLAIALLTMMAGLWNPTDAHVGTDFGFLHDTIAGKTHLFTSIAIGAFLCGVFIKGGLVPFHGWVLGAYSAGPSATSVLMAGIASKVAGVYALIRVATDVLGPSVAIDHVLLVIGALSAVVGALAAIGQKDIKRLLAYSSISQVGYILLGLGCWSHTEPFLPGS